MTERSALARMLGQVKPPAPLGFVAKDTGPWGAGETQPMGPGPQNVPSRPETGQDQDLSRLGGWKRG